MSQSPIDSINPENVMLYQQGWKALNRLLHEDRSFSGHEKNCAYLNTGGSDFADASFVTGVNFDDDGRGIALCDWDFDGDLDFWTTNRTAPRVRFMKNTAPTGKAFVTVRLEGNGTTTNRDAIGARLRLFLKGEPVPRIRSLRTSEAFLSMSSNWIHFGLGKSTEIERLEVDWPGGSTESVTGLAAGAFYLVRQDAGKAERWMPPSSGRLLLTPSTPELPRESDTSRVVLAARMLCPALPVIDGGNPRELDAELKGPLLVNLWASWCAPCVAELSEWSSNADKLIRAGLRVMALNTDALDSSLGDAKKAAALLTKIKFPFDHYAASEQTVQNLNLLQRAVLDRWLPLPVPSSFLLDESGSVAVIYRGQVSVETLLEDVQILRTAGDELRTHAVPFPGYWSHDPPGSAPLRLATQFVDFSQPDEALKYLRRYIARGGGNHLPEVERRSHHADILYVLGSLLEEDKQVDAARAAYEEAAVLNPDDVRIRAELGRLTSKSGDRVAAEKQYREVLRVNPDDSKARRGLAFALAQQQKYAEAVPFFERLVDENPRDAKLRLQCATALDRAGQVAQAVEQYKQVLGIDSKMLSAANSIARIRASDPDPALRNGQEALILSQRLCKVTANKNPAFLDTLAMAHAELGDFEKALAAAGQAAALNPDDRSLVSRVELYEVGKPFRRERP